MDRDRVLVQNAADHKQVKNAARKEKQVRELELSDLAVVLNSPEGRRVMWRLLGYCRVFAEVFADNPTQMAFNCGGRNVGLFLMNEITATDETAYFLMMREAHERERRQGDEAEALRTHSTEGVNSGETSET